MRMDVEVHLLNMKTYRDEFLAAYNSFFESGETHHLARLLNRVIGELPRKVQPTHSLTTTLAYSH